MRKIHVNFGRYQRGFTLMELLIVIALLAIVMIGGYTNWKAQIRKGFDVRRKADLARMKAMLESYNNDNSCYPDATVLNATTACGSNAFENQGMDDFVCDPETKLHYVYAPIGSPPCDGFRIFTKLAQRGDPDIAELGCAVNACGTVQNVNYGLTSGVPLVP